MFYHKNAFTFVILVLWFLIYFYCRRQHVSEVRVCCMCRVQRMVT